MELPEHLKDDASYLQCEKCKRKTYGGETINSKCNMLQPDNTRCDGVLKGKQ